MYHQKRPRTEAGGDEQDWTCGTCGNVNFSFRNSCNMRKCGAPKPPSLPTSSGAAPGTALDNTPTTTHPPPPPPSSLMGTTAAGVIPGMPPLHFAPHPSQYMASTQLPLSLQHAPALLYDPHQQQPHLSYLSPSGLAPGGFAMDPYLFRSMQGVIPYGSPIPFSPHQGLVPTQAHQGMPPPPSPQGLLQSAPMTGQDGRKRRGGPDGPPMGGGGTRRGAAIGGGEGDWLCPACGNTNFEFRTHCNMRKCGEAKPPSPSPAPPLSYPASPSIHFYQAQAYQGYPQQASLPAFQAPSYIQAPNPGINFSPQQNRRPPTKEGSAPPDGSWSCEKCGNVNYPFRTHCNKRNCGVKRGSTATEGTNGTAHGAEVKGEA